ncbi:MAG: hypothetical protein D6715_14755 [Calditrichaeota bacterium]|nr:MAG: hypothetical protein D6715_14755 [Calditrichota bacterium]
MDLTPVKWIPPRPIKKFDATEDGRPACGVAPRMRPEGGDVSMAPAARFGERKAALWGRQM